MKYTIDKFSDNFQLQDMNMMELLATGPASCVLACKKLYFNKINI